MMKFKRWKKMIVMLVVATMFLQSVVVYADDGTSMMPSQTTETSTTTNDELTSTGVTTPSGTSTEVPGVATSDGTLTEASGATTSNGTPAKEPNATTTSGTPTEASDVTTPGVTTKKVNNSDEGIDEELLETESVNEEVPIENATLKEFRTLLDQMEAFELTEENQEEYQALGMRAAELFEILTGEYYGYEGMEDDMLRFQALADKQSGGTEDLAGGTPSGGSYVMLHPASGASATGVKVSVGDTLDGCYVYKISGYDIYVDLGYYTVNNDSFRLPYPQDIWYGVTMNYAPNTYVVFTGLSTNRTPGSSTQCANGGNQAYYYNLKADSNNKPTEPVKPPVTDPSKPTTPHQVTYQLVYADSSGNKKNGNVYSYKADYTCKRSIATSKCGGTTSTTSTAHGIKNSEIYAACEEMKKHCSSEYTVVGWADSDSNMYLRNPNTAQNNASVKKDNMKLNSTIIYIIAHPVPPAPKYTYKVTYHENNTHTVENMPLDWQTTVEDTSVDYTIPAVKPTCTGFTFNGWATSAGGNVQYNAGYEYDIKLKSDDRTRDFYAKWTPNNYNYSVERYNANTGDLIDTYRTGQATFGTTITATDADKTMSGYTYKSDDSRRVESATITTAGATLKLYFTPNQNYYAKVVYNANGDNVTGKPGDYLYSGSEQNPSYTPSGAPSRTGYTFEGWSTTSGENNASDKVTTMTLTTSTTSPGPITNLYAIWKSTNGPELVVKKTVSERYVKVGEKVKYTITVKNTGNAVAKNVIVTDALPEGVKWDANGDNTDEISYKTGTRTITGDVGDIEAGQEKTVYFTAEVTKDGEISNIAKAKSDEITTPEESDPCVVTGVNMSIKTEKGHDNDKIEVDEKTGVATVPYTVTVENIGDDLYGLDIIEALTTTVTDREGNPVDDAVATQVEVSYQEVRVGGESVEDSQYKVPMSETGGTIIAIPRSEKFAKNQEVTLTYKIKIQNKSQVEVLVKLDNTATGGSWKTDEKGIRKLVRVMGMSARLAKTLGGYDVTDDAKDNVSVGGSSTTVIVPPVDNSNGIEISKVRENNAATAKIGETIYWEITVENKSNVTKTVILDEQLAYTTLESPKGTTLQDNKVELAPDESKTVYAKHTVTDTDYEQADHKLYNTVKASTGGSGEKENPETTDPGTTIDTPSTTLSVTKVADKEKVVAGEEVTYTITVTNQSKYAAENVVIEDPLKDANLEFVSWKLSNGIESKDEPSDGSYRIGTVDGSGTAVLTITAKVAEDAAEGTKISNTVTVSYSNKPDDPTDPNEKIDDLTAAEEIEVVDEPTVLTVKKEANKSNVAVGDTVVYTITGENTRDVAAKNVRVTDKLPTGLTFVSAKLDGSDMTANAGGEYVIPVLSGNTKAELVITATVDTDVTTGDTLENTATADYDNKPEKDPADPVKPFEIPKDTATVKVVEEEDADRIITIHYVDEDGNPIPGKPDVKPDSNPYKDGGNYDPAVWVKDGDVFDTPDHHYIVEKVTDPGSGKVDGSDITITVVCTVDDISPSDPEGTGKQGDGIPDKYQAVVTFAAVNGTVDEAGEDGTYKLVVTFVDSNGNPAALEDAAELRLGAAQIPGTTANTGYGNGVWDKEPNGAVITGDITFTITYSPYTPTTPTTPTTPGGGGTGGGGGGTPDPTPTPGPTPIVPEPVPAAGPVPTVTPVVTPVAPTPTATAPAAPAAEAQGPAIEALEDEEVPLAALDEEEVPLAAGEGRSWALINFALMNLAIFESLMLLIGYFTKTKNDDEERKLKKKGIFRILSIPVAVISLIAFILTEDITLPTGFVDKYTIVMLIIAIVQTVMVVLSNKKYEDEEEA